ncbi:alpha/beta hydrolase [Paenibacillus donghaensis]|jgi:pimeloyl-ACP methyl ester carboxylesterase|uniref:alpha/beta fold hydrolase n=1 Tax=Paenibacillus TaxID=44249 RepID=UPI00188385C7|nr:alpha/beta hydrolase [Paenibacillus donghaensis]MBE9917099.1 alpha/beta hydrolase [Paenibacillus donghaensis]
MKKILSKDGTTIAFDIFGNGPAIILVCAAFQTRSDRMMLQLASLLSPHFTVFNYDRRGRGDSGDTAPYAVEREVEDIETLINEAGGSAFVFGMSSGGVLALEAARKLAITKLALYEPPFVVDNSRHPLPEDYLKQLKELTTLGRRGDAVEYFLTKAAGVPADFVAPMRRAPFWPAMEDVAHTLVYDGIIMGDTMSGNPLPAERWSSVSIPTLVVGGGTSPEYQQNAVKALVDRLPNAKCHILESQDHNVAPDFLAPVLTEYFSK